MMLLQDPLVATVLQEQMGNYYSKQKKKCQSLHQRKYINASLLLSLHFNLV